MFKIISNEFKFLYKYKEFIKDLDKLIENIPRVLDNLAILKKEEYENNLYEEYYLKTRLINLINQIGQELIEK